MKPSPIHQRHGTRWLLLVPSLVVVLVMIPRLASAQFGLFDDPTSIVRSERLWRGETTLNEDVMYGRFRPVHLANFSLLYLAVGSNPFWFFVGNALIAAMVVAGLVYLVWVATHSSLAATSSGLAFVLGGPFVENSFTLSKPELLQALWLVLSLVSIAVILKPASRRRLAAAIGGAAVFVCLACLTKETAVVLAPISFVWAAVAWLWKRTSDSERGAYGVRSAYFAAAVLGVATFLVIVLSRVPSILEPAGPRADFEFDWIHLYGNSRIWADWLLRDYMYLLPLGAVALMLLFTERKLQYAHLLVDSVTWMIAWLVIYIPWRYTPEYYLLPFSIGVSIAAGALISLVVQAGKRKRRLTRLVARGCGLIAGMLFVLTIPNTASNAGMQLSIDRANESAMEYIADNLPLGSTLWFNYRPYEYYWETELLLREILGRRDIHFDQVRYQDLASGFPGENPLYVLSPVVENQPYPSVRMGVYESDARSFEKNLVDRLGPRLKLDSEFQAQYKLLTVDALRLACLVIRDGAYCDVPNSPLDTRRFAIGWRLYRVE
jgi:hypothetical protein